MSSGAAALALLLLAGPAPPCETRPESGIVSAHDPARYAEWSQETRHRIHGRWRVPRQAREGAKGTVVLRFEVSRSGKIRGVELVCADGPKSLEKAARRALKSASPLAALPEDAEERSLTVRWTFHYDRRKSEPRREQEHPTETWVR